MSNLKAIKRENVSAGSTNKLRATGFIPAILYGGKNPNQKISIEKKDVSSIPSASPSCGFVRPRSQRSARRRQERVHVESPATGAGAVGRRGRSSGESPVEGAREGGDFSEMHAPGGAGGRLVVLECDLWSWSATGGAGA